MGRDGRGGSRKRKKEMPGGLRSLRHVIMLRPGRARAFAARTPPPGPRLPPRPRARAAGVEPPGAGLVHPPPWSCGCLAHAACSAPWPRAAAPGLPPSPSWVMPHEHLHRVTFRSRALRKACAFLTRRFSRLQFPLRLPSFDLSHHPFGSLMWQSILNISRVAPSGLSSVEPSGAPEVLFRK